MRTQSISQSRQLSGFQFGLNDLFVFVLVTCAGMMFWARGYHQMAPRFQVMIIEMILMMNIFAIGGAIAWALLIGKRSRSNALFSISSALVWFGAPLTVNAVAVVWKFATA